VNASVAQERVKRILQSKKLDQVNKFAIAAAAAILTFNKGPPIIIAKELKLLRASFGTPLPLSIVDRKLAPFPRL
jgi:hypothetical protein